MHTLVLLLGEVLAAALLPIPIMLFLDHTRGRAARGRRRYALTGAYVRLIVMVVGALGSGVLAAGVLLVRLVLMGGSLVATWLRPLHHRG